MTPQTFLVDINKLRAFDAKGWLQIVNDFQPVGMTSRQLRIKIDKYWTQYFFTQETRWLNLIAVCQRELLRRKRKHITTDVNPIYHT
jgi:hypothetical protein